VAEPESTGDVIRPVPDTQVAAIALDVTHHGWANEPDLTLTNFSLFLRDNVNYSYERDIEIGEWTWVDVYTDDGDGLFDATTDTFVLGQQHGIASENYSTDASNPFLQVAAGETARAWVVVTVDAAAFIEDAVDIDFRINGSIQMSLTDDTLYDMPEGTFGNGKLTFGNTPPTPGTTEVVVERGGTATFALEGTDPDGDTLTYAVLDDPIFGTLLPDGNGDFVYTHDGSHGTTDFATFTMDDGFSTGTGGLLITVVDTLPAVEDLLVVVDEDSSVQLTLPGEVDDDDATFAVGDPLFGTLSDLDPSAGTVTYTAAPDTSGEDRFSYTLTAGGVDASATVTVVVVDNLFDDDDGDGLIDAEDPCPLVWDDGSDLDGDGFGDACDDDVDGDGFPAGSDCDDTDAANLPEAAYPDPDDDGWGTTAGRVWRCAGLQAGEVHVGGDNCPDVANPGLEDADGGGLGDACDPDDDGDGLLDSADPCPFDDGIVCTDRDADGHDDGADNCPDVANEDQVDADGDGWGDPCDPCPAIADATTGCPSMPQPVARGLQVRLDPTLGLEDSATGLTADTGPYDSADPATPRLRSARPAGCTTATGAFGGLPLLAMLTLLRRRRSSR